MMFGFELIPGNDTLKASLRTALARRFPQAVLLSGPDGSGKTSLAYTLAAALLCTTPSSQPCGFCTSCRKMEHRTHPDCIIIDEGEKDIKVDLARNIREQTSVLPNDGSRKVFILSHAEHMNHAAQNALLKVLEEPPYYVSFILTSSQPDMLLQTVRSRCTLYQLEPPALSPQENPDLLMKIGQFLIALAQFNEYDMLLAANALSKFNQPAQIFTLLKVAFRDAALVSVPPLIPALREQTHILSRKLSPKTLVALCDYCSLLSQQTKYHASVSMQFTALAAGAYHICSPLKNESQTGGV